MDKIFFYLIDKETLLPTLENVMYNYIKCSNLMFGKHVQYGIAYSHLQPDFVIFNREYTHDF